MAAFSFLGALRAAFFVENTRFSLFKGPCVRRFFDKGRFSGFKGPCVRRCCLNKDGFRFLRGLAYAIFFEKLQF